MAKLRGKHEGTIYKREDGTFRAQIAWDGRRLNFSAKTQQECQFWLKKTINQIDSGMSFEGANMKLSQFMDLWLKTIKENRREKTYIQYLDITNRFIIPTFGNIKLRDLQPIRIEKYFTEKQSEGVGDRTVQIIYSVLHSALNSALKKGLIGRNPLAAVEKPRIKNPRKKITLDSSQVQAFFMAINGERLETLYHLAISTGMRQGEILGLMWTDIDWERKRLKIERQIQRIPGKGLVFSPPKTDTGKRILSLGEATIQNLIEHKQRQELEMNFAGERWQEFGLIFTTPIGTPLDCSNVIHDFKRVIAEAGLPPMRFHDLRHTSITLLLNEVGVAVKVAQTRAGHTRPSTTLDIYAGDISTRLDEEAAQQLDELITPIKIELHRNCTEEESAIYK